MKNLIKLVPIYFLLAAVSACSSDDDATAPEDFVVAFETPSVNFNVGDGDKQINLVFSRRAPTAGTLTVSYTGSNADYGDDADFVTVPAAKNGVITVDIASGAESSSFTFKKLKDAIEGTTKTIDFTISSVSIANGMANGTTTTQVAFEETAALGGNFAPEVGGPNQPNQVYVDLSGQNETAVKRNTWELGFYNGTEFRVKLNGSLYMAAAALDETDIDAVTAESVAELQPAVAVATFEAENTAYIDAPNGEISGTAIAGISETDAENSVYLVNLGKKVGTETPAVGSEAVAVEEGRGWMKMRVLRAENGYTLQYATLEASTHKEVTIPKDDTFNFQFFSLLTEQVVSVEPEKTKWELNFTVFTNEIPGAGSYGFADFVATNRLAGVQAYKVENKTKTYADFSATDVDESTFSPDQTAIGSHWRMGGGPSTLPTLDESVYFVVKDAEANLYKVRFTALVNESGVRGYPEFEYELLQ